MIISKLSVSSDPSVVDSLQNLAVVLITQAMRQLYEYETH